jgi:ankyrin repeat protein
MSNSKPTADEREELLLSCRYGDLEDIQRFVEQFGPHSLSDIHDENGNTTMHMVCGNGHTGAFQPRVFRRCIKNLIFARFGTDVLDYLLPIIPPSLLSAQNSALSSPLHWAAINSHLAIVQKLVQYPGGPGVDLIDIKNTAGRSPLGEAEFAGWEEGAKWLVQMMKLDTGEGVKEEEDDTGEEPGADEAGSAEKQVQDIEVEIEDADGQVARMTIGGAGGHA